ncbi:MAG: hypothetical protein ABUL60_30525 [Myxococcales bacterium]
MKKRVSSRAAQSFVLSLALLWGACAVEPPADPASSAAGVGGQASTASGSATGGVAGAPTSAGVATGGSTVSSSGAPPLGGAATAGSSGSGSGGGSGGMIAGSGSGGASNSAGSSGTASAAGGGPMIPPGCMLSSPVSFKADVGPWLNTSCGKGKGNGCHVTDDSSTVNSLCPDGTNKCGFSHAYDWITAGSHNQFCKQTPGPIRYTVVMDVVRGANPPSCTSTRVMPPDGPPLDACQMAALEAWLTEPKVLQVHRADDTSPAEPYLMPPFN